MTLFDTDVLSLDGIEIKNEKGESIGTVQPSSRRMQVLNSDSETPILFFEKKFQLKLHPDIEIKDEKGKVIAFLKKKEGWFKKKYIMENPQGIVILKNETNENQETIQDDKGVKIAEVIKKEPSFKELIRGKFPIWTLTIDNTDFDRIMIFSFFASRYAADNFKEDVMGYVPS